MIKIHAKPELKERLVVMNGGPHGFLQMVSDRLEVQGRDVPQTTYLSAVLGGGRPVAVGLAIALTRIAEDDLAMPHDDAWQKVPEWFNVEGGNGE